MTMYAPSLDPIARTRAAILRNQIGACTLRTAFHGRTRAPSRNGLGTERVCQLRSNGRSRHHLAGSIVSRGGRRLTASAPSWLTVVTPPIPRRYATDLQVPPRRPAQSATSPEMSRSSCRTTGTKAMTARTLQSKMGSVRSSRLLMRVQVGDNCRQMAVLGRSLRRVSTKLYAEVASGAVGRTQQRVNGAFQLMVLAVLS